MYKAGSLIDLILEFTKQQSIQRLGNIPTRERLRLQKFLSGLRIEVKSALNPGTSVMRTIKKLSQAAAHTLTFTSRDGRVSTVSEYFRRQNCPLKYPNLPCVEVDCYLWRVHLADTCAGCIQRPYPSRGL